MSAFMGVDLGEKRVGIAVSDEMGSIASALTSLSFQNGRQVLNEIQKIADEYRVTKIIVGFPKTLKNEIGIAAQKITKQVEWFKVNSKLEWELWDERLSTAEVERVLLDFDISREKRKDIRDQLAAQRILQNYLDFHRNKK